MMDPLEVVLIEAKDRLAMLSTALQNGHCATYDEYKYICGQIRGLESACGIVLDLQKKMENADE
jgi:hypothetical protein